MFTKKKLREIRDESLYKQKETDDLRWGAAYMELAMAADRLHAMISRARASRSSLID